MRRNNLISFIDRPEVRAAGNKCLQEGLFRRRTAGFQGRSIVLSFFFLALSACTETQFSASVVVQKAQIILPPLGELIRLKIRLNQTTLKKKDLQDEANDKIISINDQLSRKAGLLLSAYKEAAGGKNNARTESKAREIQNRVDRNRKEVAQIRERTKPLYQELADLKAQIAVLSPKVKKLVEESRELNTALPPDFVAALDLVHTANGVHAKAEERLSVFVRLVTEHNNHVSEINRLSEQGAVLYRKAGYNLVEELEDNLQEQKQLRSVQKDIIARLKKVRRQEEDLRQEEVEALTKALNLFETVSRGQTDA